MFQNASELGISFLTKCSSCSNGFNNVWVVASKEIKEFPFEFWNFTGNHSIQETSDTSINDTYLFFSWHWYVLALFKEFSQDSTSVKELLSGSIEVRTELGEGSYFSVLGKFKFKSTSNGFHSFNLGSRTDSGHRDTDIKSWSNTFIEKLSFKENLSISN